MSRAAPLRAAFPRPPRPPRPILVWDTETTGLGPAKHNLVEIGLMELPATAPTPAVYSFSSLIHPPGTALPRAASRVHGITNPMMQDAPPFTEVWAAVREYVAQVCGRRGRPLLVAHNLSFDLGFLRAELGRNGRPMPDWDFACSLRDVAHILWPGQKASLAALAARFGVVNEEAHRALCDVEATAKILEKADDELREAARSAGKPIKSKGEYIREMLENAALRRRQAALGEAAGPSAVGPASVSGGKEQVPSVLPATSKKATPTVLPPPLQQYYTTPTGTFWHSSRGCEKLDMANVILRITRKPLGKLPCRTCNEAATVLKAPVVRSVSPGNASAGISKKCAPPRRSPRITSRPKR